MMLLVLWGCRTFASSSCASSTLTTIRSCPFFTLEFCCDFYLEAEGLPPANPPSKPTLNCSKQEGGDRCFLTCQSQVHISSGELVEPDVHIAWFTCHDDEPGVVRTYPTSVGLTIYLYRTAVEVVCLTIISCWGFKVCTTPLMNQSWPAKLLYIHLVDMTRHTSVKCTAVLRPKHHGAVQVRYHPVQLC